MEGEKKNPSVLHIQAIQDLDLDLDSAVELQASYWCNHPASSGSAAAAAPDTRWSQLEVK